MSSIRIATVGRQRTLSGLAKALFDTKGSAALQERAEAALLRANPGLAEAGGFKTGAAVIVPPLRDVPPKAEPAPAAPPSPPAGGGDQTPLPGGRRGRPRGQDMRHPSLSVARERITSLAELGGMSVAAALGAAKRTASDLRSSETIDALVAARPDLRERLDAVRAAADKEVDRIAQAGKELQGLAALALGDLAELGEALKADG